MNNLLKIEKVDDVQDIDSPSTGDAGVDLKASGKWVIGLDDDKKEIVSPEYELEPGERILVKTGIKVQIPPMFWGNIRDRSGLAFKQGVHTLAGVIDESYRGEVGVVIINLGKKPYTLSKNDRVAQMIITPYMPVEIEHVKDLDKTQREANGFGSSGK